MCVQSLYMYVPPMGSMYVCAYVYVFVCVMELLFHSNRKCLSYSSSWLPVVILKHICLLSAYSKAVKKPPSCNMQAYSISN